jgi:hypothetical protein
LELPQAQPGWKLLCPGTGARHNQRGHTITEMMIACGLFSLVILGILGAHFAGLRFYQLIQPKVQNAQYERQTVSRLIEEVRSANSLQVGTGTVSAFTVAGPTNVQTGNALRIYMQTNSPNYIYYFHDQATATVQRVASGTNAVIIANCVTNHAIFSMQDFAGNTLTNSQNNAVLSLLLQFKRDSAWKGISDAAQVRTKATRRNIL